MKLRYVQVGKPQEVVWDGRPLYTAMEKYRVNGKVYLRKHQLEGDKQADDVNHGGRDKAVCLYPVEHVPYWEEVLHRKLPEAPFGENFTMEGMLEEEVNIGAQYRVGEALIEITQPRMPCHKLASRYEAPSLVKQVMDTGYSGFYAKVLEEGAVEAGDAVTFVQSGEQGVTVAEVNRAKHDPDAEAALIAHVLSEKALAAVWRAPLEAKLEKRR
ncbi:MOSC domain-containing protein [Alkalicoccus urumqiensis]|uniref:MOSC domain-containing protein n=1 Tax=Alkalicoccus urumqiensis TaxID=1548213 RepID=A0A2P6MJ29_ALKUR|nr:MOSC domain-containing protein [Alkalicoccus urumqiensis]PRO66289.1 MOSC domain-containing protein [Alkalicoccus urumqiensis]